MTAIFAYAKDDVAFVAGDTMRGIPLFGNVCARKVHYWSETVLIAQAGDGNFQSDLIAQLIAKRPNIEVHFKGQPSDQQFISAYKGAHPTHHANAAKAFSKYASGNKLIVGTLLVASAADASGPARIHKLDFASGSVTRSSNVIEAEGDDPTAFFAIATTELPKFQQQKPFSIDLWAMECVSQAVQVNPTTIGWPADILLSRLDATRRHRLTIDRRVNAHAAPALPEFGL